MTTRINLRLWHQGLILVGVPIGLMLLFVVSLTFLLSQAELKAREVNRSKTVISKADALLKEYFDAGSQLLFYKYTKSDAARVAFERHLEDSINDFVELRDLLSDDPQAVDRINELQASAQEGIGLLKDYARRLQAKETIPTLEQVMIYKQFNDAGIDFTNKEQEFVKIETEKHRVNEREEEKSRALVKGFLLSGVVAAVAVGAMLVFFMRNTTGRLANLMENTMLLRFNQPLLPALEGDDEMARLDASFRTMAADLAEARRKERAIVDHAVDVICSIDEDGKFKAVNPASLAVWGYTRDELIGRHFSEILSHEDSAKFLATLDQLKRDKTLINIENEVIGHDSRKISMLWSLRWSEEEHALFCVAHDISDRKRLEQMKQEFLAVISHELRTPLTSLQAVLSLITTGMYGKLNDSGEQRIRSAQASTTRLIMLINDLLDMEKMEAGKLTMSYRDVDLSEVVTDSVESVRGFAEEYDIALQAAGQNGKPLKALADPDRLVQVMVNLLSNAIKFSPKGTPVEINILNGGEFNEVHIVDHGAGVPSGYEEEIFEKYEQVPNAKGTKKLASTGLGLPICKAIIEQHGGEIGVRPTPGGGSTFWFSIPRA